MLLPCVKLELCTADCSGLVPFKEQLYRTTFSSPKPWDSRSYHPNFCLVQPRGKCASLCSASLACGPRRLEASSEGNILLLEPSSAKDYTLKKCSQVVDMSKEHKNSKASKTEECTCASSAQPVDRLSDQHASLHVLSLQSSQILKIQILCCPRI